MNGPAHWNDRELFESIAAGDRQALAELAKRHSRGLYDFALRGTQDEAQAGAVVTAVLRRIQEPSVDAPSQIDTRTWLYSLALVEVLDVANETRTARVSTDDERFFRPTTAVDPEIIAQYAWQAARALRTRDYCVLDLTLRRGLTPEEVAEAASLTRSNLYASIGRARGAFEETFAAVLLFEHGRDACAELDEMVEGAPGSGLRPALRHQIIEHSDDCDACRLTLDSMPPAASVYVSLADVDLPETFADRMLVGEEKGEANAEAWPPASVEGAAATTLLGETIIPEPPELVVPEDSPAPVYEAQLPVESDADLDAFDLPGGERSLEVAEKDVWAAPLVVEEELLPPAEEFDQAYPEDEATGVREEGEVAAFVLPGTEAGEEDVNDFESEASDQVESTERIPLGARIAAWANGVGGQSAIWTYAAVGIAGIIAVYLGIAVANSLQGGGGDSGAVPLDTDPGLAVAREIDCGDTPIELNGGSSSVISFDEEQLAGYRIETVSFAPVSTFAEFGDLEATLEGPFALRFVAKQQDTAEPRTEEFELRIRWEKDGQAASSACQLLIHLTPQ